VQKFIVHFWPGGIVVGKLNTQPVTLLKIKSYKLYIYLEDALDTIEIRKILDNAVVWTNGWSRLRVHVTPLRISLGKRQLRPCLVTTI
jgi:hypothetical protein